MSEEGIERRIKSLKEYWPILVVIGGSIIGYIKLTWQMQDTRTDVDELISKKLPEEHRFTAIEKDIEWLKSPRR